MSSPLHLPDLTIKGFRGIDQLTIPRLGRVTLLAGKNGVGKTTVLEAVRLYADRGNSDILFRILADREQVAEFPGENGGGSVAFTSEPLFHGWSPDRSAQITIGPNDAQLEIDRCSDEKLPDGEIHGIRIRFGGAERTTWESFRPASPAVSDRLAKPFEQLRSQGENSFPGVKCLCIGPEMPAASDLSSWWNDVELTVKEDRLSEAVALATGADVVRAGILGGNESNRGKRRAFVRLRDQEYPVPLKSLGDGAVRLFGVALALANSRGGFLLIDEAENGIHHTIQYDLWRMVLHTAHSNDVQVLATTHSWDCVRGFAYAAAATRNAEGVLVRLDRDDRGLRAVEYSEEDLKIAADQGIEVR